MTDNWKEEPQQDLQSKLTLYVMGEADEATCLEVEAALKEDNALRAQHEELVRALDLLRQPQLQPVLGNERRDSLRAVAAERSVDESSQTLSGGKILTIPRWSVAAALLIFGGMITIWQQPWQMPSPESSQAASGPALHEIGYPDDFVAMDSLGYSGGTSLGYASDQEIVNLERQRDGLRGELSAISAEKDSELRESLAPTLLQELGYHSEGDIWNYDVGAGGDSNGQSVGLVVATPMPPAAPAPGSPATPGLGPTTGRGGAVVDFRGLGTPPRLSGDDSIVFNDFGSDAGESSNTKDSRGLLFADSDDLNIVGRSENLYAFGRARTENILDAYGNRLQYEAGHSLIDGYGRRYQNGQVLIYIQPQYPQEKPSDMFFRFYGDNPEVYTRNEHLSTFSADVDTASYPLTRNFLVNNQLPPKASIRTEEFLNYFDYAMVAPTEEDFAVQIQATRSKFGNENQILLSIGIKAREVAAADRPAMNLVFVIDKSGSMAGERMQLVKDALMLLVDQIRDTDTIGLVTFDSQGHVVLASTPGTERYLIREAIRNLGTGGSTNAGEGLRLGYLMMEKVYNAESINRVVLASDGVANTGVTDQETILKQVTERAEARVDLTTLGVGMGNHNDVFLEQLADKGNGSCHYLDDLKEAKRVLVDGFLGTMITVARDVKIQVEFDAKQVLRWRQLGYENRSLAHQDFRNDAIDAGEVGSGHEVVALYEVEPTAKADVEAGLVTVRLRWKPEGSDKAVEREYTLNMGAGLGRWESAPVRLREMAVVAQYAEVLRRSWHARTDSYTTLQFEAKRLAVELEGESEVKELAAMIDRTAQLARWAPAEDDLSMLLEEARRQRLLEAELVLVSPANDVEELLKQVRQQNLLLEGQLEKMLQRD